MLRLVKGLNTDSEEVDDGKCMREVMKSSVSVRRKEVKSEGLHGKYHE